jgi:hypothetical protein
MPTSSSVSRPPCSSRKPRSSRSTSSLRRRLPPRSFPLALLAIAGLLGPSVLAATYHVSPSGDDSAAGTADSPWRTLQAAAERLRAGDTCFVQAGVYRETVQPHHSGQRGKPIRFEAAPGSRPVIDGSEPIHGPWSVHKGRIYRTQVGSEFAQLFADGRMLVEARWPNRSFPDQLWDRDRWATADTGSRYGLMIDSELAATGIDWTGGLAVLNVAHQFFTWTRPVLRHAPGSDTFEYSQDLAGITRYATETRPWEDDRYYLVGKLEALDMPGEWHLDRSSHTLYLWLPDGSDPGAHRITAKARDHGLIIEEKSHVEIRGIDFFACGFRFDRCTAGLVEDARLLYPAFARHLDEPGHTEDRACPQMNGDDHAVRRCLFAWSATDGLRLSGRRNTVEDCLVQDFSWDGSLAHGGLRLENTGDTADGSTIRQATVRRGGNALVNFRGPGHVIERNHVYDGGRACKDVALVYTGLPTCAGGIVRHNWVHGCRTEEGGGLGIRGDDQTRGLTVHHNVVWDCGRDGIIVKGDHNIVCNNTVFEIGIPEKPGNFVNLHVEPEPKKPWRNQWPLLEVQNQNSRIANNAAITITGSNSGSPYPFGDNMEHNYQGLHLGLVNPAHHDFRPSSDSPLVDAGIVIGGITDGFHGAAPDIGAYESGIAPWKPGISWNPEAEKE